MGISYTFEHTRLKRTWMFKNCLFITSETRKNWTLKRRWYTSACRLTQYAWATYWPLETSFVVCTWPLNCFFPILVVMMCVIPKVDCIWSCGELCLWPLDPKFSDMINTVQVCLFDWQKVISGIVEWNFDAKAVLLPIFGHMVTLIFDLWK